MAPVKKPRKVAAKKTTARKTAVKSRPAVKSKVAAKKTASKKATKKSAPVEKEVRFPRVYDAFGFVQNTDSSIIAHALVEGGAGRNELNDTIAAQIEKANGLQTRTGGDKLVPSLVSGILNRLLKDGYTIESSWALIPPAEVRKALSSQKAAAKRKAGRSKK